MNKTETTRILNIKSITPGLFLFAAGLTVTLSSCSSAGVQKRVDRRSETLEQMGQNMELRQEARDERFKNSRDRVLN